MKNEKLLQEYSSSKNLTDFLIIFLQVQISNGYHVYMDGRTLWSHAKSHRQNADVMFRELMLECVPPQVLALPHITAAGTKDTVGVPKPIWKAVAGK